MSMITLNGMLHNVFSTAASTDKKTGEMIPASTRIQLLASNGLQNGETRSELVTIKVSDITPYKPLIGRPVTVPVGAFASGNQIIWFEQKGEVVREGA
jgi:hypothetical protein